MKKQELLYSCKKNFSIIKRYEIFSHDLQTSFEKLNHKFNTQLHHMKNKIGVLSDPVYSKSYPWIIPKFTLKTEKPNIFIITQDFHHGKLLDDRAHSDEMQFWQFKHYEMFHVNDPAVLWGPRDLASCNLLFDGAQICFVDNEGFSHFHFRKRDYFRYKIMSMINPNIGEYMTGKDSNTSYEIMEDDWSRHDGVKIFFKRLFLYEKILLNFQDCHLDEKALKNVESFINTNTLFKRKLLLYQNWFYHEGERVMQMTDKYVKPKNRLQVLARDKYPELFKALSHENS